VNWGIYKAPQPDVPGSATGLTGWAVFLSNALAILFLPVFVIYMTASNRAGRAGRSPPVGKEFAAYKTVARK